MLVYAADMGSRRAKVLLASALCLACAGRASAAPLRPSDPALSFVLEGLYGVPGAEASRGAGAGLRVGYRVNDQVQTAAGFSTTLAHGKPVTLLAAGFEAVLDLTPIAPFLELSVVRADPADRVGYSLATRTGFGADYRFSKSMAVGAVLRYFTPLDASGPLVGSLPNQFEFALRLVLIPSFAR